MEPFIRIKSKVVPLPRADVDTDQIIPARYLKATGKSGMGEALFADWRRDPTGAPVPDFPLNRPECQGARILLTQANFGCGSSREHAVWALLGSGFKSVIAPSFGDIFRSNAIKNGLLPVELPAGTIDRLFGDLEVEPQAEVAIDLEGEWVRLPGGEQVPFKTDSFARFTLLQGMDHLDFLLSLEGEIKTFENLREGANA
jgi:3-isopropylmalate/(R)-2-methylmalate dehydratase small subunit